jgi:hypothetical protein
MDFSTGFGWARLPLLAAALMLGFVAAAPAQDAPAATALQTIPAAAPDDEAEAEAAPDAGDADVLSNIDIDKLDWSQLATDAGTLNDAVAAKKRAAKAAAEAGLKWSSDKRADGTSGVTVKQSVSPFWDARIGADMTVAPEPTTMSELLAQKAANGGNVPTSSGSAWLAATAPGAGAIWDKTAVEARLDPGAETSKVGASLTKSVPLSGDYGLTLRNGYNFIQQGTTPIPGIAGHISRSYETDQSAKMTITDTGTSFIAGQTLSTADDRWLRTLGAEQKLFDNVTVSGSVGETAQGTVSKSLRAGYKKTW